MRRVKKQTFLPAFRLSKRQKFVGVTVFLTTGLVLTQLISFEFRHGFVVGLAVAAYFLSAWALREDLQGAEWFTLLILPTLFTAAAALFFFLLPTRWIFRVPIAAIYAVGMYAILLTENIFNVSAGRSIQLVRAAQSIGLLMTLITFFFLFNTAFAFRLPVYLYGLLISIIAFPLVLQSLWSVVLTEKRPAKPIWVYSFGTAVIVGEVAVTLCFWPVRGNIAAMFTTSVLYTMLGLGQQRLLDRIFRATIREMLLVTGIVFIIMFLTTHWGS